MTNKAGRPPKRGEAGRNRTIRVAEQSYRLAKRDAERFGFPSLADYMHAKILAESHQEAAGRLKLAAELDASQIAHLDTARALQRVSKERDHLRLELAGVEGRFGALLGILKDHCPPQILSRLPLENIRKESA